MMSLPMKWICSTSGSARNLSKCALARALRRLVEVVLQRGEVADRRVEPDVEVLARRVGDLDAEVGRVAGDVPVGEAAVAVLVDLEPLADLVAAPRAAGGRLLGPAAQELDAARVGELEEEVLGLDFSTGFAPVSAEYGFFRSVGA